MRKLKKGFTLAEVLITLAIIGVVAAIVIPSVMMNYQVKTVGVKLAKFAGAIENSARAYVASDGTFTQVAGVGNNGAINAGDANANIINSFLRDALVVRDVYRSGENGGATITRRTGAANEVGDRYTGYVTRGVAPVDDATGVFGLYGTTVDNQQVNTFAVLKDNTKVAAFPLTSNDATTGWNNRGINTAKVGQGAFLLVFDPNVGGLNSTTQKTFDFVVTESGYVFPSQNDQCLWDIYTADWNSTTDIMTGANCQQQQANP